MLFFKSRKTEQTILLPQEHTGGAVRRRENAFAGARYAEAKLQAARAKTAAAFLLAPVAGEEAAAALFSIVRVEERRAANRAARAVAEAGGEFGAETERVLRGEVKTGGVQTNGADGAEENRFARRHYESRPASYRAEREKGGREEHCARCGYTRGGETRTCRACGETRGVERSQGAEEEPADALDELISGLSLLRGLNVRERGGRREE